MANTTFDGLNTRFADYGVAAYLYGRQHQPSCRPTDDSIAPSLGVKIVIQALDCGQKSPSCSGIRNLQLSVPA
jgi:hypothetical protein